MGNRLLIMCLYGVRNRRVVKQNGDVICCFNFNDGTYEIYKNNYKFVTKLDDKNKAKFAYNIIAN